MDPVSMTLMAAPYILNAAGGIFGKKKKYLDPEMAKQKYGPAAISEETQQIANMILNSPYGQELLKGAATSGQNLQTDMASRAAMSGLDPSSGGESGASTFATSAAKQAQTGLEGQTRAGVWQQAMPLAAANVAGRMALEQGNLAEQNLEPSTFQKIAAAAGSMSGKSVLSGGGSNVAPTAAASALSPSPSPISAPIPTPAMRAPGEQGQLAAVSPSRAMVAPRSRGRAFLRPRSENVA